MDPAPDSELQKITARMRWLRTIEQRAITEYDRAPDGSEAKQEATLRLSSAVQAIGECEKRIDGLIGG